MTREIIEDYRKIVIPFMKDKLLKINYEGLGESDAEEYEKHSNEILDMALQTLNQQPCEDAISREYLVEHIKACWTNGRPMYSPDLSELLSWIDDVPCVQPKMKTAKWIRDKKFDDWFRCSECGRNLCGIPTNFCDTCGSKMTVDEGENHENQNEC